MDKKWQAIYISTSISNWKDKLQRKFRLPEWHFLKSRGKSAVFFGMYNPVDYFRLMWHKGPKTVFWCGSDILNLQNRPVWQKIIAKIPASHICENVVEAEGLKEMGISPDKVKPCLFDDMSNIEVSFKPSKKPHVYLCIQPLREREYGLELIETNMARACPEVTFHVYGKSKPFHEVWWEDGILHNRDYAHHPNIVYHGKVPNEQFNEEIKDYQAALRMNEFDGFSEVLAKSILIGQYPISRIPYPKGIDSYQTTEELVVLLEDLKNKRKPNPEVRRWQQILK